MEKKNAITVINSRLLNRSPDVELIYLYGSFVRLPFHQCNDIDIALLTEKNIDRLSIFHLQNELARALDKDVDLIDLKAANTVLQAQVVAYGENIYHNDFQKKEAFEERVFQDYIDFKDMMAPIYRDIQESGTIYE